MNSTEENKEIKIGSNYILYAEKKLGKGAFGEIHKGKFVKDGSDVAIKREDATKINPQLSIETKILVLLKGGEGIPNVFYYFENDKNNYMVMELLGKSIEDIFNQYNRNFSAKTILMIGMQMISRVQYVHSKGIIHRDIKPDNYLMGSGKNCHLVYLIDFGLAKRYKDPKTGIHIKYKDGKSLTGTARYASVFTLMGIEQSRRDDLESIAYSIIYLFRGDLPWQGIKAKTKKDKYSKILEMKKYMRLEELCKGMHRNIINFLIYCRELNFEERPDYEYLYSLLESIFDDCEFEYDFKYDWVITQDDFCDKNEIEKNSKELLSLNKINEINKIHSFKKRENSKSNNYKIGENENNNIIKTAGKNRDSIKNTGLLTNVKAGINNFNNSSNKMVCKNNNEGFKIKENLIDIENDNDVDSDKDTEEYIPRNLDYDIQILD